MIFNRRIITHLLDLINLQRHNDNYADIEADLTDHEQRISDAKGDITSHKASEAAHAAEHITYSGPVAGASDIKGAVDIVKTELDQAIISGDSGPEAAASRYNPYTGVTHATLPDRLNSEYEQSEGKFALVNAQLAEKAQQIKGIDVPYNYQGPVVTFIDDDGANRFLTETKPVLDAKGVTITLGIVSSFVGTSVYMTKTQLTSLQDEGHEIVSHTKTHAETIFKSSAHDLSLVPDADIEAEYRDSRQWLIDNGFNGYDTLVYPWGGFGGQAVRYKRLARKYYKNAVNATGAHNGSPSDNMYLNRTFLNINQDFTTVLKPIIDATVANNGWLILGSHSGDIANFNGTYLATVIDYIQSFSVPILTFGEAEKLKGNALSVGEFTDTDKKLYVGRDGAKSGITVPIKVVEGIYTSIAGNTMDDVITKYDKYKLTITHIQNTGDTLIGQGGTLETYHGDDFYSFQRYTVADGKVYYRKWSGANATGSWAAWIRLALAGQYSGQRLATEPITNYNNGTEYADISGSNSTIASFPEGLPGTLFTYRNSAGDVYSYQEYKIRQSNKKYGRYWDVTNSIWTAWVKTSVV